MCIFERYNSFFFFFAKLNIYPTSPEAAGWKGPKTDNQPKK